MILDEDVDGDESVTGKRGRGVVATPWKMIDAVFLCVAS